MAALYTVLVEADPTSDMATPKERDAAKEAKSKAPRTRIDRREREQPASNPPTAVARASNGALPAAPGIAINVQIHISADASPDQIEQIFASMAKHIYRTA